MREHEDRHPVVVVPVGQPVVQATADAAQRVVRAVAGAGDEAVEGRDAWFPVACVPAFFS